MLPKLGNSKFSEQTLALEEILPLLKEYQVIVLGDREFCSVDLGNCLKTRGVSFCLRLKKNQCLETENLLWQRLDSLGIVPGTSLYFQGVRVRKTKPVTGFDIACKWKRNYRASKVKEAWFLLADLGSLSVAITTYSKRMGIVGHSLPLGIEMFRDYKKGGYNLEGTGLKGERLIKVILLMTLAYSSAIFKSQEIQKKSVQKYVSRCKDNGRKYRRRSIFGMGLDGEQWSHYLTQYSESIEELTSLTPNKRRFYQQGLSAATFIQSRS